MSTEQDTTDQTQQTASPQSDSTTITAGDLLKERREALCLSQQQIAERLRLKISVIENIENNQFERGQVATFTRGYLRSYAKLVQLDEKKLLATLDARGEAQHAEHSMQSFSRKTKREKHDSHIMKITWGIALIVIGISATWFWQSKQDDLMDLDMKVNESIEAESASLGASQSLSESGPVASDFAIEPADVSNEAGVELEQVNEAGDLSAASEVASNEPIVVDRDESIDTSIEQAASEEQVVQPEVVENQTEATTAETTETQEKSIVVQESSTALLAMSFSSDCWIQVTDANGKTLTTGIKKAGQSLNLDGERPLKVILGAPEAVSMTFASEPVDLSGYTSGKVARITLP